MNQTKKKHNEHVDNAGTKCSDDREMKNSRRIMRIILKVLLIILAVIMTLAILKLSFWLNYQVITGRAESNILFWKMAK